MIISEPRPSQRDKTHCKIITFPTSLVALVSFGERPSLMRSSTLFGGGFSGAVRATELNVTANMTASRILQTSISSRNNEK